MKQVLTIPLLVISLGYAAQSSLTINWNIRLPKDSVLNKRIISGLEKFLSAAQKPDYDYQFILPSEKAETAILLDEIAGSEINEKKADSKYLPQLLNLSKLSERKYNVKVGYFAVNDNRTLLRSIFSLIATDSAGSVYFSSPLRANARYWKTEGKNPVTVHYRNGIDNKKFSEYVQLTKTFDKKLGVQDQTTEFYCCDDLDEALQLMGVVHKTDYNGRTQTVFSCSTGGHNLVILGNNNHRFTNVDPHDLWHERLSNKIARTLVNRPVDEGCAFLYGGSWGLTWQQILVKFKQKLNSDSVDWKAQKEKPMDVSDNPAEPILSDYVVNALLVKKIEHEKGFGGVWELLNCGPVQKGHDNYYATLEKLTGITKENYNLKIRELIAKN
jgi:hypothetical protein